MYITMVKKRLRDGSDCRKCTEATHHLRKRGLWEEIDAVVWAHEGEPDSPGMVLGAHFGVYQAPFFVVRRDDNSETVYTSVLQLVRDCFHQSLASPDHACAVDPDDIGGI